MYAHISIRRACTRLGGPPPPPNMSRPDGERQVVIQLETSYLQRLPNAIKGTLVII